MHFDGSFRRIGTVDAQPLLEVVESFGEDAWFEYVKRQEKFQVHRQTHTIPLIFDEDMRHTEPTTWPRFAEIESAMRPALDAIRQAHPPVAGGEDGYFVRIILTRLSAGAYIPPHRDRGNAIMLSHRHHMALRTNEKVDFGVDGEIQHFAPGEIWEINNRRLHAVRNLGEEARIHLILDYVVPGEKVEDPDEGLLVA